MADLRAALDAFAAGRLSRRAFLTRASAAGLSATLAGALAHDPAVGRTILPPSQAAAIGPATDRVIFTSINVDQAPLQIQNGDMDLYIFGLKTAAARELADRGSDEVRLIEAPASTLSLVLNPAPDETGFNPFSIAEIRRAVQFLVDRDLIANNIYQGQAVPMYTHVSPLDADELTIFETVRSRNIRYDLEFARGVIEEQMTAAGADRGPDGTWAFNGRPIALKFVTRIEDERREVGDLVRAALEDVGFQVQPLYQPFGPATLAVYASDPITFQWHIYTEGWGRSSPNRYDQGAVNSFIAPWLGNMPGWRETGYWQYENEEADTLGRAIFRGEFGSQDERNEMYRRMVEIGLDDSVRVWLVTAVQSFPIRTNVENVTEDLVGGPKSLFTLREASIPDRDEIRVGHLWVWTERTTWNPVGGFGDVYSTDISRNINDPGIVNHPFEGIPIPYRTEFDVETAGPDGTLDIPEDAVLWDAEAKIWAPVGAGQSAVSKVTYDLSKFFSASYHHGQPITPADIFYEAARSFEIAYDENKLRIETAIGATSRPYLETLRGYRLLDDDRIEVYVNFWHFEPSYIASYANPGSAGTPWELNYAMDEVVFTLRTGAYSDTAAARFNVPWLSLTVDRDNRLILRAMRQLLQENRVPEGVFEIGGRSLVTPEEAAARYQASLDWFDTHGLLVVGQGPYQLTRYDPPAQFAELTAYRDDAYPFGPGDWAFGTPQRLSITVAPPDSVMLGEGAEVAVTVGGPGALDLRYVLVDSTTGTILTSGEATGGDDGTFTVSIGPDITATLFPSIYQLYLLASSDEIAQVVESRVDLSIGL